MQLSREYTLALILVLGSLLKVFGFELENNVIEGLVAGGVALYIAYRRYKKGDITPLGKVIVNTR